MKFTTNEKDLANNLLPGSVMLERVRQAREKLVDGTDYVTTPEGILYSKDGMKKLLALLKVDEPEKNAPKVSATSATQTLLKGLAKTPEKKRVTKLSPYQGNRKYLKAVDVDGGQEVTVHVKDNVNFTHDMTIEVIKGFAGVWDYVGPMPRSRGRM